MSNVMAIDLETKNLSSDIGGWGNTHMFLVSTVTTWNGSAGTVYVDEPVSDSFAKSGTQTKSLRELKFDLDDHFKKGGLLLGHNIISFDLPVLRDAMDIYCIRKYMSQKQYIDTSQYLLKERGERYALNNLVDHTLGQQKTMHSMDAPRLWKKGEYDAVVDYCLKDSQLVYDLWKHGQEKGTVKAFNINKEEQIEMEVNW
tara:strand:- start:1360 stop:1959 length:600 start_codon:yes stop_codon:yes gene_type:complete